MTAPDLRRTLRRPDDWHLHLRDGAELRAVVNATASVFGRAIIMPNLRPPVTTVAAAAAYRERIVAALAPGVSFTPLMTLYLTDSTSADEVERARASGFVHALKYYPAGATTHSESGVTALERAYPARWSARAWCSRCTARSPIRTSTCSIASAYSSSGISRASCAIFPACASCSST
jgi:dihydroorotase